jgi:hypothetical protein
MNCHEVTLSLLPGIQIKTPMARPGGGTDNHIHPPMATGQVVGSRGQERMTSSKGGGWAMDYGPVELL